MTTVKPLKTKTNQSPRTKYTTQQRQSKEIKRRATQIQKNSKNLKITSVEQYKLDQQNESAGSIKHRIEKLYVNGMTAKEIATVTEIARTYIDSTIRALNKEVRSNNLAIYTSKIATDMHLLIASHSDRHTYYFRELIRLELELESVTELIHEMESVDAGTPAKQAKADAEQLAEHKRVQSSLRSKHLTIQDKMIRNDAAYVDALTKVGVGSLQPANDNKEPIHSQTKLKSEKSLVGLSGKELVDEVEGSVKRLKQYVKRVNVEVASDVEVVEAEVIEPKAGEEDE